MAADPAREDRRHRPEGDDGQRTPFQRDRDAVLHSSCFRRLAGVTQVVDPAEGQVFHNRLTHTLEVAQIALRLAEHLLRTQRDAVDAHGGLDPSAVEAAALIHDLGHPPFGHVAEKKLNQLVWRAGVGCGYEGNAQSLRLVTKLAVRRDDPLAPGLNLTRATLNATLKYPWIQTLSPQGRQIERKWGAYRTESDDLNFARANHAKDVRAQSLEAQIMDWSDDVAYSVSDTEDFYRAGLIPLGELATAARGDSNALDDFLDWAFQRRSEAGISNSWPESDMRAAFSELFDIMPFSGAYEPSMRQRAAVRGVTSQLIGLFLLSVKVRATPGLRGELLDIPDSIAMQVEMLKELTWRYVIRGPSLAAMQYGQNRIIRSLFGIFCDAASQDKSQRWDVLPISSRDQLRLLRETNGAITQEQRVRVAADAVAGMTDRQAVETCKRLTGVSPGSAFNQILG